MSQTWSLVCHETKQKIWIGQGTGFMSNFYTSEPETMALLAQFLVDHSDKDLVFICDDTDWDCITYSQYTKQTVPQTGAGPRDFNIVKDP